MKGCNASLQNAREGDATCATINGDDTTLIA